MMGLIKAVLAEFGFPACHRCNGFGFVPGLYGVYETECPVCNGGVDEVAEFHAAVRAERKRKEGK